MEKSTVGESLMSLLQSVALSLSSLIPRAKPQKGRAISVESFFLIGNRWLTRVIIIIEFLNLMRRHFQLPPISYTRTSA